MRSTDLDRTLVSAQSQLSGWYVPAVSPFDDSSLRWFPIPVHTVPQPQDLLLLAGGSCPRYNQLKKTHPSRPVYLAKLSEAAPDIVCQYLVRRTPCNNGDVVRAVGGLTGLPTLTLQDIWMVTDTYVCLRAHNYTVANWMDPSRGPAQAALVTHLMALQDWAMYDDFSGDEERRLTGGPLVYNILQQFQAKLDPAGDPAIKAKKVQLYSAHDTTVASFLTALDPNHFGFISPPYATAVAVELHLVGNTPSVWLGLKNNTPSGAWDSIVQPLVLPGCVEFCPLDRFISLTRAVAESDIATACEVKNTAAFDRTPYVALAILLPILALLVILAAFLYTRRMNKVRGNLPYKMTVLRNDTSL